MSAYKNAPQGAPTPAGQKSGSTLPGNHLMQSITQFERYHQGSIHTPPSRVWIRNNQMSRRNLPEFVKIELQLENEADIAAQAKERQIRKPVDSVPLNLEEQNKADRETNAEIANFAGVSRATACKYEKVAEKAAATL